MGEYWRMVSRRSWRSRLLSSVSARTADFVASVLVRIPSQGTARRRSDANVVSAWQQGVAADPNPLLRAGRKYFSHFDEDGILAAILARIGLASGTFLEIGVGDGTKNNTIHLMAQGWSGQWIDCEPLSWRPTGRRL